MTDRCPPHNFKAAWASEDRGVLFCSLCGDIRELAPQSVEAPVSEFTATTVLTMPPGDSEDFAPGKLK